MGNAPEIFLKEKNGVLLSKSLKYECIWIKEMEIKHF